LYTGKKYEGNQTLRGVIPYAEEEKATHSEGTGYKYILYADPEGGTADEKEKGDQKIQT
jgi:hypothetical protein